MPWSVDELLAVAAATGDCYGHEALQPPFAKQGARQLLQQAGGDPAAVPLDVIPPIMPQAGRLVIKQARPYPFCVIDDAAELAAWQDVPRLVIRRLSDPAWIRESEAADPCGIVPLTKIGSSRTPAEMAEAIANMLAHGEKVAAGPDDPASQGYSPLVHTLLGSLLAGGLGYAGGTVMEHLFPERYLDRGTLRKTLGLAGLGLGTIPGIYEASLNRGLTEGGPAPLNWWKAFTTPTGKMQLGPGIQQRMEAHRRTQNPPAAAQKEVRAAHDWSGFHQPRGPMVAGTGLQAVPVDAFNNAIWNDVHKGQRAATNPYGTKSPWGDNTQPLHTPPQLGAATSGIVSGIQSMYNGQSVLSPRHFINGLMAATGDVVTAKMVGGVLGALGGLTPVAQEKLQDFGLWGGLIRGTVGSMLGMR